MSANKVVKWLKGQLYTIFTIAIIAILFVVIFTAFEVQGLTTKFWVEFSLVMMIAINMRTNWFQKAESDAKHDTKTDRDTYYAYAETNVDDITDFEEYLEDLNELNRENYIKEKMGSDTQQTNPKKYARVLKKANKLRPNRATDIITNSTSKLKYDARNYYKLNKTLYLISSTLIQTVGILVLAMMVFTDFVLTWGNVVRFISYLFTILMAAGTGYMSAQLLLEHKTYDHIERCQFIIDKYTQDKKKYNNLKYNDKYILKKGEEYGV